MSTAAPRYNPRRRSSYVPPFEAWQRRKNRAEFVRDVVRLLAFGVTAWVGVCASQWLTVLAWAVLGK